MKKRLIGLVCSIVILSLIFINIDAKAMWGNIRSTDVGLFSIALLLFIPQNLVIAGRWKLLAERFTPMDWGTSLALVLAGHSMNIVLPSKLGDMCKAVFLKNSGALDLSRGLNLVVFEKLLDVASLCLWALVGITLVLSGIAAFETSNAFWAIVGISGALSLAVLAIVIGIYTIPLDVLRGILESRSSTSKKLQKIYRFAEAGHDVVALLRKRESRRGLVIFLSIFLWGLHLAQIYYFFASVDVRLPLLAFTALMPLAIFIGLLPFSLFGVGTRDAAVIFFFAAYADEAQLAAGALFLVLRYLIPAVAGLPFLYRYISLGREGAELAKSFTAQDQGPL